VNDDDIFISSRKAAILFGVTERTLRNWVNNDHLQGKVRVRTLPGGTRRFSEHDITTYLKEHTQ
jgi:DNA-binding transcriptional MerR regulator